MTRADDEVAIRHLLHAYADVVTTREWARLDGLFHPEVDLEIAVAGREPLHLKGPSAFADFVARAVDAFDFFVFQLLNVHVDVTGEHRAEARTFMTELRQADGEFSQVYGRYDDELGRIDGRWWFTARHYRTLARTAATGTSLDVF